MARVTAFGVQRTAARRRSRGQRAQHSSDLDAVPSTAPKRGGAAKTTGLTVGYALDAHAADYRHAPSVQVAVAGHVTPRRIETGLALFERALPCGMYPFSGLCSTHCDAHDNDRRPTPASTCLRRLPVTSSVSRRVSSIDYAGRDAGCSSARISLRALPRLGWRVAARSSFSRSCRLTMSVSSIVGTIVSRVASTAASALYFVNPRFATAPARSIAAVRRGFANWVGSLRAPSPPSPFEARSAGSATG